jgi:hypothetical protein
MSAGSYLQLLQDVYALTGRPDRVAETALAVRKATLKYHLSDLWKNDLTTSTVTLPVINSGTDLSFRYALDLTDSVAYPLVKRISSIKEYNAIPTGREIQFEEYDSDNILTDYRVERLNYWYQMGRQVTLRANKILVQLAVQYWKYPNVTTASYNSWIADQFPDFISCEAASSVFATIGKVDEAARYAQMFNGPDGISGNLGLLRISEI